MSAALAWEHELHDWLEPFLAHLGHPARRRMCPLYVAGLIGPGERKSLQPIAARLAPADYDQLHHFVAVSRLRPCWLVRDGSASPGGTAPKVRSGLSLRPGACAWQTALRCASAGVPASTFQERRSG